MLNNYSFLQIIWLIVCFNSLLSRPLSAQSTETIDRLRNKAESLYAQGDYPKALTHYLDGYRLARRTDGVRAANLAVDISSIYHMRGEFRRGATLCHEGVTLLQRAATQPDSVWFKLNSSLGEMYKKLNDQDSCYLYFSRANALLQQHPELENRIPDYVIYHYNNQGMMYVRAGGYTEGLSYLTKALAIAEKKATSKEDIAILQNNLGELYEGLGLFKKALLLRKSALRNYPKKDFYKYQIYSGISWDALQHASYREGLFYATNAFILSKSIAEKTPTHSNLLAATLALNWIGKSYYLLGNYEQAVEYYKSALKRHNAILGNRGNVVAYSYLGLANAEKARGHLTKALLLCQSALIASHLDFHSNKLSSNPTPEQALSDQSLFESLVLKAELLSQRFNSTGRLADLHNAYLTYECALAVADAMRKSYNALDTKWFFATQVRPAYLRAFETAYSFYQHTHKADDQERAFSLLERAKAAALTDVTRELLIKPANVPADLLAQERALQRTITTLKLHDADTPPTKLTDAQIRLAQLQQRLENEFPAYYRAKYRPQSVQAAQVRATLDNQTAYLSYLLTPNALYVAVVTHEGLHISRRANSKALTTAVQTLRTALYTNPGLGNYIGAAAARTAYRWLIDPVAHQLAGKDRLIVSRDGDLHRLPFDVLETGQTTDDFLVKHHAISYVASASALLNRPGAGPDKQANSLLGLAPFTEPTNAKAITLSYLPASRSEVEGLPGEALTGRAATKRRFMRTYANYELLHLATHARANDAEPARSYIAFYPDGNPDKLYAEEIHNLSLTRTQLVVLSACETGNGKLQAGEGVMSLAQAFAYAGCPSVISTLWNAHDASTAYLSQRLYAHLQAGHPIDVALQRTRLDYFRSDLFPKLNHPHYWANFVLIGDRQPVYVPSPSITQLIGIALLILLLPGVLLLVRHRTRSRAAQTRLRQPASDQ